MRPEDFRRQRGTAPVPLWKATLPVKTHIRRFLWEGGCGFSLGTLQRTRPNGAPDSRRIHLQTGPLIIAQWKVQFRHRTVLWQEPLTHGDGFRHTGACNHSVVSIYSSIVPPSQWAGHNSVIFTRRLDAANWRGKKTPPPSSGVFAQIHMCVFTIAARPFICKMKNAIRPAAAAHRRAEQQTPPL